MKLERLALWDEKYLFTEQGETDKGFIGWLKGNFSLLFRDTRYVLPTRLQRLLPFLLLPFV